MKKLAIVLLSWLLCSQVLAGTSTTIRVTAMIDGVATAVDLVGWKLVYDGTNYSAIMTEIDVEDVINPTSTNMTVGTPENPIKELYCSGNSVHVGDEILSETDIGSAKAKAKFTSRGGLPSWDIDGATNFVINGAFNTVDLSSIITDTNVVAVNIHCNLKCDTAGYEIRIRKTGDTGTPNTKRYPIPQENVDWYPDFLVPIGSARTLDFRFDGTTNNWSKIKIAITEYFTTE
jgi:hypothetical protein